MIWPFCENFFATLRSNRLNYYLADELDEDEDEVYGDDPFPDPIPDKKSRSNFALACAAFLRSVI